MNCSCKKTEGTRQLEISLLIIGASSVLQNELRFRDTIVVFGERIIIASGKSAKAVLSTKQYSNEKRKEFKVP
jgi:hypothetical protein